MSKPIAPIDAGDLRRLLASTTHTFTTPPNETWVREFSLGELRAVYARGDEKIRKQIVDFCRTMATSSSTPMESLVELARDPDVSVRVAVASNPNASSDCLAVLTRDKDSTVRIAVAANPNATAELISVFTNDSFGILRRTAAANPNAKGDVLAAFARDHLGIVRSAAAASPNATSEVLAGLARDPDAAVRKAVSANRNAPADALAQLARDDDSSVRMAVASNPGTSQTVLTALARDNDWAVRKVATSNPKAPSVAEKEGCFVATAATGSCNHEITLTLREFRDVVLLKSQTGRQFVEFYYLNSPALASWIRSRRRARFLIKWFALYPISSVARLFLIR